MKRWMQVLYVGVLSLCIAGCGIRNLETETEVDLDYTVVQEEYIPDAVKQVIEKEKAEEFQMTYQTEGYLYLLKGYGLQNSGGYSISVEQLSLRGESIYCKTRLIGPKETDVLTPEVSYPYLVLKTEYRDAPVVFES